MTNQTPPPNWLLPPTPWAPWVPDVTLGRAPAVMPTTLTWVAPSVDGWDQSDSYRGNLGDADRVEVPHRGLLSLWLDSVQPSGGNGGILGRLSLPVGQPWDDAWPSNVGTPGWMPPTLPAASALPLTFPTALPGSYESAPWTPGNDLYLSPVPQAPSWDAVPSPSTATSAAQIFPEPSTPLSWGTPEGVIGGTGSVPTDELATVPGTYRDAAEHLRRGGGASASPSDSWSGSHWWRTPFDANVGFLATTTQPDNQSWENPGMHDPRPAMWASPKLPSPFASPSAVASEPLGSWNNAPLRQTSFGTNAGIVATPAQRDGQWWGDASPRIEDQKQWGASTVIRPSAPTPVTNSHSITSLAPTPASDAGPEDWIPGARYAANRPRRGTTGPGGWELSPLEEIRLEFHKYAHRTLRELDPRNPQLQSLSSPTWIPTFQDINRLNEEIARVRGEQRLFDLERHHALPREFVSEFEKAGIDMGDYIVYLQRHQHRLRPDGLHTGSDHWNGQWHRFFQKYAKPTPKKILEQLNDMLKQLPR
jgi:hypothetical protein